MQRIKNYISVSNSLACLSNGKLKQILADATLMHDGIGGKSALISIDDVPVFVKKIPLTDLEQLPQHVMSTANMFDLPLVYQYGVGSAGFGAWRELAAYVMTSNGVITGECEYFPILYHWRVLPNEENESNIVNVAAWGDINQYYEYWENSSAIRDRVDAINTASSHIALFLEYIPYNLNEWLPAQIVKGDAEAVSAMNLVNEQLKAANEYMKAHGLIHFDAHFKNVLTDGERIYVSDFGLALSSHFDLSSDEIEFFKQHQDYDESYACLNLLISLFGGLSKKDPWDIVLRECVLDSQKSCAPAIVQLIEQYQPVASCMDEFLEKLRWESKSTLYPAVELEKLLS